MDIRHRSGERVELGPGLTRFLELVLKFVQDMIKR